VVFGQDSVDSVCVVMSAYNKVQPIGEGQQESGECSEGNGEITSVSDP